MSKKKDDTNGWVFSEGEQATTGTKVFGPGLIRDVTGKDLEDAQACAQEVDRIVAANTVGQREQNKIAADALRAQADALENSV